MMINRLWILLCLLLTSYAVIAQSLPRQNGDTSGIRDGRLISAYVKGIKDKTDRLDQQLNKYTARALKKVQKQENNLRKKLAKKDSLKEATVFGNATERYKQLEHRLQNVKDIQQYIPAFDTIRTSVKFLQQNPQLAAVAKESGKVKETLSKVNGLGSRLEQAEEVKTFLKERKEYLKDQLQDLGFAKQIKKCTKQAHYYSEQLNEYRSLLKDHRKGERKAIQLLSKTKLFQNFMRKNSMLASLFRLPGDPDDPSSFGGAGGSFAGLQTRVQVNNFIQQQIGTSGQAQLQQNMQDAQSELNQLKEKLLKASRFGRGLEGADAEIPEGFKANDQKTKSFLKRLEIGTNIQSQKANTIFPTSSDIGLSIGYKLNDRSVIGIGLSYLVGWGQNIRHIKITHQGVGLRSFVDWKINGSLWLSGGYEMNYRREIRNIEQLKNYSAWQPSGLVGLNKVVSLKTKFFKKTKLQLLWDFLSYQQAPGTQTVVFRIGYNIR